MDKLRALLTWIDRNLLFILSAFLLAFIPLFPKIPLFDALPGYIVKVRLEDFFVILTGVIWLKDIFQKRIAWNTSAFWFVTLYAGAGLISILLGVGLLQTIPAELLHIGKSGLHFFRYLEYFSLFFFLFSAIRSRTQIIWAIGILTVTLLGVVGFGLGQKYAHFPVYSTMNREYSKGEKLYLQEGAKPQSTFAGHYDLAAFLVIILPITFSLALRKIRTPFSFGSWMIAGIFFFAHLAGLFMLILTASATALGGYGIAMLLVILFHLARLPSKKQRFLWAGASLIFGLLGLTGGWMIAPQHTKEKALGLFFPKSAGSGAPTDLIGDGYSDKIVETRQPDGSIVREIIKEKSTWSPNALKYGISMGIRLDTLWPQALLGLARSPLTGSGYGTLAMLDTKGFQEADSTDNNFLRTLGETGILGFLAFYGMIVFVIIETYRASKEKDSLIGPLAIGFFGASIGLLTTAIYLDVFAASKVAFMYWAIAGIVLKGYSLVSNTAWTSERLLASVRSLRQHFLAYWPIYLAILSLFFFLHQNPFLKTSPTKNIAEMVDGLENLTSARCFIQHGSLSLCRNSGMIITPHFSLYALLLVPLYRVSSVAGVFSYLNLMILLLISGAVFALLRKKTRSLTTFFILMTITSIALLLRLTQTPWSSQLTIIVLIGFPVLGFTLARIPKATWVIAAVAAILFAIGLVREPMVPRYRPTVTTDAADAVDTANQILGNAAPKKSYLVSALNPLFVDLHSTNRYTLLPLSARQTYGDQPSTYWEATLTNELVATQDVFVSDYTAQKNQPYAAEFAQLKKDYDLHYARLGCEERCNVYSLYPSTALFSNPFQSAFSKKMFAPASLPRSYQFSVIPTVFSPELQDSTISYDSRTFVQELEPLVKAPQQFMIIAGDAIHKPEKVHAGFIQNFAARASYPILYAQGNDKLVPVKYVPGAFQSFFTETEYFILLHVDPQSRISDEERLALYDAFFQLEKLPNIKSLFIIAQDLDWQNPSTPDNAVVAIKRKLADFPSLSTYILTANHGSDLITAERWDERKQDGQITYHAALTAGNSRDVYLNIAVNAGVVNITPQRLVLPQ